VLPGMAVDREAIAVHQKNLATLRERVGKATETLRAEQKVHEVAERKYRAAVAVLVAIATNWRRRSMPLRAGWWSRAIAAMQRARPSNTIASSPKVIAAAHRPMYEDGIRGRLAASKEAAPAQGGAGGGSSRVSRRLRANASCVRLWLARRSRRAGTSERLALACWYRMRRKKDMD
jgi:hypothetical protein